MCNALESKAGEISCKIFQSRYETLSQGVHRNQFIEFANDLTLLTDGTAIGNIYVRESYKTVTTLISDAIKEKIKKFVVTGTPGIGKTIFLHYFLWVLITRQTSINDQVDRKIYLQRSNRRIYSFQGDRVVSIDAGVAEGTILDDKNCILLVDMVEENEPVRCSGTIIIFSSPNPKRYKQHLKGRSRQFVLNSWTLEEVKAVWVHAYQHIQWDTVERVYDKMGGVIRYVLEQNDVADITMKLGLGKAKNWFIEITKNIDGHFTSYEDGTVMYHVRHMYSPDHAIDNSKFVFASDYARKECLKVLKLEERERVLAFLML